MFDFSPPLVYSVRSSFFVVIFAASVEVLALSLSGGTLCCWAHRLTLCFSKRRAVGEVRWRLFCEGNSTSNLGSCTERRRRPCVSGECFEIYCGREEARE